MIVETPVCTEGTTCLAIQGEMTIYSVKEHKQTLLSYLACDNQEIQIDLSGVDEIDSAGIQLLMFIKREAIEGNRKLSLHQHSLCVIEALELMNLNQTFGDPVILSAHRNKS